MELTDCNSGYHKSAQKLSTDEYYQESLMEGLKNFRPSLGGLMSYYKLILLVVNSFSEFLPANI